MEGIKFESGKNGAKLLALALAFSLCLFAFPTGIVRADDSVAKLVGVDVTDVTAGSEDVEMAISISDCPPFWGMSLDISYGEGLTLTGIEPGSSVPVGAIFDGAILDKGDVADRVTISTTALANMTALDGTLFTLKFKVAESAVSGSYNVKVGLSQSAPSNFINFDAQILGITFGGEETIGVVGQIEVTGLSAAKVGETEYETLSEALTAALNESSATITMLSSVTVSQVSDRIVIPDGKEITLDMNGKTITSTLAGGTTVSNALVEVQSGGKLELVDRSVQKGGGFAHDTGAKDTLFLTNSGVLNMSDIEVVNFYNVIKDGSLFLDYSPGNYETIEGCNFTSCDLVPTGTPYRVGLDFGAGSVDEILDCTVNYEGDWSRAIQVGKYGGEDDGTLKLLKDCTIYGTFAVGKKGKVETIKGCSFNLLNISTVRSQLINVEGYVGLIEGGSFEFRANWWVAFYVESGGHVEKIKGSVFEGSSADSFDMILVGGYIGDIEDVKVESQSKCIGFGDAGRLEKITSGTFTSQWGDTISNGNEGTLGEISGGTFTALGSGYNAIYFKGNIEEISGGTFVSNASTIYCSKKYSWEKGTIDLISGGTFISNESSAVLLEGAGAGVQEITGGTFIGKEAALRFRGTTTGNSVKGGVFYGEQAAVILDDVVDKWEWTKLQENPEQWGYGWVTYEYESHVEGISGGYYKTLGEDLIVSGEDCTWDKEEGYDFATVPLRTQDLPADFHGTDIIADPTGFYHFGETAQVTWKVDGVENTDDLFVMDDPVYYSHATPLKDGFKFKGWQLGDNLYRPQDDMPVASGPVTYQAAFLAQGDPMDYEVALALPDTQSKNVNVGEVFEIDVFVTSFSNEAFFGATVPIEFEHAKVEYVEFVSPLTGLDIGPISEGSFEILGAAAGDDGWAITDGSAKLGTLKFKAKSGVASSSTEIAIGKDPIVDQYDAVGNQVVEAGGPVEINLWNLQVTFQAGDNVTMNPAQAVAYVKYDQAGLWANADYSGAFTEPGLEPAAHYTLDDPVWSSAAGDNVSFGTIESTAFTANAVYMATAHAKSYAFKDLQDALENVNGLVDGNATYLTDVTFNVKAKEGYGLDKVSYRVDGGALTVLTGESGVYTIAGSLITGAIEVQVDYRVSGGITFISNNDYRALPNGFKILVLTVGEKLSGQAYTYDGELMFYSPLYSKVDANEYVYLYVVANDVDVAYALPLIQIATGACIELAYNGDVNCDNRFNSTDAVLTYGLYKGVHEQDTSFTRVKMKMLLEADVNGDGEVDVQDATAVLNILWNK